jgi:hypothetical protein
MKHAVIELTQGNINNSHLYLASVIDLFPKSAIGGSNEEAAANTKLEIHCGFGEPIFTDIAGDKNIFRKRSWVREFFETHKLICGDRVIIENTGANRFHVFPHRK